MNFCPNCGEKLEGIQADCCPACGCIFEEESGPPKEKAKHKPTFHALRQRLAPSKRDEPEMEAGPAEDGYDGYYEDVPPMDEGRDREGIEPETVKKIAVLAAGALLIIAACVARMYLI